MDAALCRGGHIPTTRSQSPHGSPHTSRRRLPPSQVSFKKYHFLFIHFGNANSLCPRLVASKLLFQELKHLKPKEEPGPS